MVDIFGDDDARETCWDIVSSDTTGPERTLATGSTCCNGPVIAVIRAKRSILLAQSSVYGRSRPLQIFLDDVFDIASQSHQRGF
jgi:hypothetical protein